MKRPEWPVLGEGISSFGPPNRCVHCKAIVGGQHAADCVIRERTVVIEARITYTISVPEHWTTEQIEFRRNQSTMCSGTTLLDELCEVYADPNDKEEPSPDPNDPTRFNCLCTQVEWKYVREATQEDEDRDGVKVRDFPS